MRSASPIFAEGTAPFGFGYGMAADISASCILWTLLQIIMLQWPDLSAYKMKRNTYLDFRNRQVSIVHGILILSLSALEYLKNGNEQCGSLTSQGQYNAIIISCGYFTYDFLAMTYLGLLDMDMTVHHLAAMAAMASTVHYGFGSHYWIPGLIIGEISNAPMHGRVLLKHLGLRYTRAYEVAEFLYFISYSVARTFGCPILTYFVVICEPVDLVMKSVLFIVTLQSLHNVYRMKSIVMRRFQEINERNKKKLTFGWLTPIPQKDLEKCQFYIQSQKHKEKIP